MRADLLAVAGPLTMPAAPPGPATPEREQDATPALAPLRGVLRPRRPGRVAALVLAGGLVLGGLAGTAALVRSSRSRAAPSPTVAAIAPPLATLASPLPTPPATAPATAPPPAAVSTPATPTPQPTEAPTATAAAPTPAPATATANLPTPTAVEEAAPTVPPTSPATASDFAATFGPEELQGAYRRDDGRLYGRQTVALYGDGTGYSSGTLTFEVAAPPAGPLTLILTGLDDESATHCGLTVILNGVTIFDGPTTFPNTPASDHGVGGSDRYWDQMQLTIPPGTLLAGTNTLTLQNTTPARALGVPYILISAVQFGGEP
jgi:hypothetical protein